MKIHVLDGGPRKKWNTNRMCESFAEGARSKGAEVEIVRLFELDYRGCYSCFVCRRKGGESYGRCGYPDKIRELLEQVALGDGVVFASPIYFGEITAQLRGFMERLCFPFQTYDEQYSQVTPKRLETAVIYTMNVTEEAFLDYLGTWALGHFEGVLARIFTAPERICAFNTYQFSDYDKYVSGAWNEKEKARQREEQFPKDLQNAFDAGVRMAEKIAAKQ